MLLSVVSIALTISVAMTKANNHVYDSMFVTSLPVYYVQFFLGTSIWHVATVQNN